MSKVKVQMKSKIQMSQKDFFGIQSFGIDLIFGFWHLTF